MEQWKTEDIGMLEYSAGMGMIKVDVDMQTISARELHERLEVRYDFKRWTEYNFKDFSEGVDYFGGSHRCEWQPVRRAAVHCRL